MTGWLEWSGGACPVPGFINVDVRYRDGTTDRASADRWPWGHEGTPDDIVAYRLCPAMSPVTAHGAVTTDRASFVDVPREYGASQHRYPAPARADLVTLWKRGSEPVLSITADGKVKEFHLPPARLVVLLRELADLLAENTVLK